MCNGLSTWSRRISAITVVLAGITLPAASFAQSLDVNLNDDTGQATVSMPLSLGGFGRSSWDAGFLYHEANNSDNWAVSLGAVVQGAAGGDAPGLEFGAGMRIYVVDTGQKDVTAVPLGLQVRYAPPAFSRFFGELDGYYAPDIVTFNDGKDFFAGQVRLGYEILPEAEIYVGYRNIEAGIKKQQDATVAEGGFLGLKIIF